MKVLLLWLVATSASILELAAAGTVKRSATTVHSWQRRAPAPADHVVRLHIAVRVADGGAEIERQLLAVSDPSSPSFRQHLNPQAAMALSMPDAEAAACVERWLDEHGLLEHAIASAGVYEIDADVAAAQRLLNTTYHVYVHDGRSIVRIEEYQLPESVAEFVDFVSPTTWFPRPAAAVHPIPEPVPPKYELVKRAAGTQTSCGTNDLTSPACIRQIYGINYNAAPNRTTFAVYGTEAATYSQADLHSFLSQHNAAAAQDQAQFIVIGNGAPNETAGIEPAFETALDTQTLMGLAWPAQGWLYLNGGVFGPSPGATYDPFVQFLQGFIANTSVPSVVSFSESHPEADFDPVYARRLCHMLAQAGTRGVSLLFSTGDNGPSTWDGGNRAALFEPRFPASCPWVTAVGGTTDLAGEAAATQSTVPLLARVSFAATGGGFSEVFGAPAYQRAATRKYVAEQVPARYGKVPGFSPRGRGYPDVAAFSTGFPVVLGIVNFPVAGTSTSTPAWAAVVALLNDYEAAKGRPPLGFLNPWLYGLASGLKDITTGGNNAGTCGLSCGFADLPGYNVSEGWDCVTGLGSPIFNELTEALDAIAR